MQHHQEYQVQFTLIVESSRDADIVSRLSTTAKFFQCAATFVKVFHVYYCMYMYYMSKIIGTYKVKILLRTNFGSLTGPDLTGGKL